MHIKLRVYQDLQYIYHIPISDVWRRQYLYFVTDTVIIWYHCPVSRYHYSECLDCFYRLLRQLLHFNNSMNSSDKRWYKVSTQMSMHLHNVAWMSLQRGGKVTTLQRHCAFAYSSRKHNRRNIVTTSLQRQRHRNGMTTSLQCYDVAATLYRRSCDLVCLLGSLSVTGLILVMLQPSRDPKGSGDEEQTMSQQNNIIAIYDIQRKIYSKRGNTRAKANRQNVSQRMTKPTKWHDSDQPGHPPSLISIRCLHEES